MICLRYYFLIIHWIFFLFSNKNIDIVGMD